MFWSIIHIYVLINHTYLCFDQSYIYMFWSIIHFYVSINHTFICSDQSYISMFWSVIHFYVLIIHTFLCFDQSYIFMFWSSSLVILIFQMFYLSAYFLFSIHYVLLLYLLRTWKVQTLTYVHAVESWFKIYWFQIFPDFNSKRQQ